MFEQVVIWFSNFQNVLGLVFIGSSMAVLLKALDMSSKYYKN